ncbi:hypothetical protein EFN46_05100 [Leuconostoc pseudomesenteroides]|uniref:hypothetical protein n=1 Tax=Leuconostoc pseudomesenteroides TaxID=33968 RepID=UPI0021AA6A68|nr:hypothetical protein [Leuconostoc pseudomesenteroides]MCT4387598.1 hypothetical protein [Leuconostoc pseudomesenteroides]
MADEIVLTTQKWLNKTYSSVSNFQQVTENGCTGLVNNLCLNLGTTAPATPAVISAIYFALFGVR